MNMARAIGLLAVLAVFLRAAPLPAADHGFVVVVHPAVQIDLINLEQLGRIFQKKMTRWPSGQAIMPVELGGDGATQRDFYRLTMAYTLGEVGTYWIRRAMTDGVQPPRKFRTPEQVLKYVAITPGAVGFVPPGTQLTDGVKPLPVH